MSKTNANIFEHAPCVGLWNLFDSTRPDHHASAAKKCATCPVIAACERRRDDLLAGSRTTELNTVGTWAGQLLSPGVAANVA